MTLLERTRQHVPTLVTAEDDPWRAALGAAATGVVAAFGSLLAVCVPVFAGWLAEERSSVSMWQALAVGADGWALAHRATVELGQTSLYLAPLLLSVVPLLCCRWAAGHVLRGLPDRSPEQVGVWRSIAGTELLLLVAGYVAAGVLIAYLAGLGPAPVDVPTMLPGLLLLSVLGTLLALWRQARNAGEGPGHRAQVWVAGRTPVLLQRALRPAVHGLVLLGLVGVLVVALLAGLQADRVGSLYTALDAGVVGGTVLTVGQLMALPNLALWALAWVCGAGFELGAVSVTWSQTEPGTLPLIPALGILPEPGPLPAGMWLGFLLPVAAGAWVGWRCLKATTLLATWRAKVLTAGLACGLTSAVLVALAVVGNAGLRPGDLSHIGVDPLAVGALVLLELLAGALTVVSVQHWRRTRAG